ncbi:hypothetical protein CNY89_09185 [Amaricoccus sp. HAR-UPW-R2A-40]|nr:hypothetical protein CNY89_09185 [Amaricoccus sp. HAR-UPW-R2A-40]
MGFYGAAEYDLSLIETSPRESLELGRSCVAAGHRGGPGMHLLWSGLAEYVLERDIEILFGTASFPGTDPAPLAEALSFLHHAPAPTPRPWPSRRRSVRRRPSSSRSKGLRRPSFRPRHRVAAHLEHGDQLASFFGQHRGVLLARHGTTHGALPRAAQVIVDVHAL